MTNFRESEDDKKHQTRLFQVFSKKMGYSYKQFSPYSNKYRIDGCLYESNTRDIKMWVEAKWYTKDAFCWINIPKYQELVNLSETTQCPSYFVFREYDKWGYICIHNGEEKISEYKTQLTGGTPKGRPENDDDIEPLIILDKRYIHWGNE